MNAPGPHEPGTGIGPRTGPGTGRARLHVVHEPTHRAGLDQATQEARARALAEIKRMRAELPPVDPDVYACYLGELVRQVEADTEADPVGILASLVCAAGVHLGPGPHVPTGDDRHPLLVWPLVIGVTNGGRKGAGWGTAARLLVAADAEFMTVNFSSGLSSGEGLAAMFAEPDPSPPAGNDASGGTRRRGRNETPTPGTRLPNGDRRLLVFESEWANVIAKMRREGNSLSATLRQAWEGGNLSTMTVAARIVTESHIGLLAHITPVEFRAKVSSSDLAGGTYNRFLPVAVHQTQMLPGGTGTDPAVVDSIGTQLRERLRHARRAGPVGFTTDGLAVWHRLYYEFGVTRGGNEAVEQFISRAAPYCLRIAAIHAVLDGRHEMTAQHLAAAAGLVRYSIASAGTVFNDKLTRLAAWITDAGPVGRTRKEITTGFYQGHAKTADIQASLDQLTASGRITRTMRPSDSGRGRAAEVYTATPANDANQRT